MKSLSQALEKIKYGVCVSTPIFSFVLAEEIDTMLQVTLENKLCCTPFHSEISCQMKYVQS